MTPVFADTFFFLAHLNASDQQHHAKARLANRVNRPTVTSWWVLLELGDHLCDLRNRRLFEQTLEAIRHDNRYEIIPAEQAALERAVQMYTNRPDKTWSLTDCTSFVVMTDRAIVEALSADHHSEQAGFIPLLK